MGKTSERLEPLEELGESTDEGFTLIELMVVILIIAILLAVAVPTFLGARSRTQDRAAQANLSHALTAAKSGYIDTSNYTDADSLASMDSLETALSFVTGTPTPGTNQISVSTAGDANKQTLLMADLSSTGTCWYVLDAQTQLSTLVGVTVPSIGTWFASTPNAASCSASAVPTPTTGWQSHY